jgi:hypothetical protein
MPEPIINFTYNWNSKLFCKFFSTIRLHNPHKYAVGNRYHIQLNSKDIGPGIIRAITPFRLDRFTPSMALLDMGYPLDEAKKVILNMYKAKNINWSTQILDFMVIEMPEKIVIPFPDELFGTWQDAPDPVDNQPKTLFTQS